MNEDRGTRLGPEREGLCHCTELRKAFATISQLYDTALAPMRPEDDASGDLSESCVPIRHGRALAAR